jgi:hypothetical protein
MNHADRWTEGQDSPRVSLHAQRRIRQRGLKEADLSRLQRFGEEMNDGYLMTDRTINSWIAELKSEIQRLERLRGLVLIEQDNNVVTVYRSSRHREHRILSGQARHMQTDKRRIL